MAGNVPPKADLGDLGGLAAGVGGKAEVMIDGKEFDGAKAYKDSKVLPLAVLLIVLPVVLPSGTAG